MWAKLVFLNIKDFLKNKPVLFFFILLSQMICMVSAFTVAGMMDAVTAPPQAEDNRSEWDRSFEMRFEQYSVISNENPFLIIVYDTRTGSVLYSKDPVDDSGEEYDYEQQAGKIINQLSLPLNKDTLPTYGDIRPKLQKIRKAMGGHYVALSVTGYTDDSFELMFSAVDSAQNDSGLTGGTVNLRTDAPVSSIQAKQGDTVTIGSRGYTVGTVTNTPEGTFPMTTCQLLAEDADDSFIVLSARIEVDDGLTGDELGYISNLIRQEFSGLTSEINDPVPKPLMEKQFNNMIYVVSFLLMATMMLNLSRLYTYILAKRHNALSVYALCGGSKRKIFSVYLSEILLTLIVSYVCGFLLFRFVVMGLIGRVYPSFLTFFDWQICMLILCSYILFGGIVMGVSILPLIRKSVSQFRREGSV